MYMYGVNKYEIEMKMKRTFIKKTHIKHTQAHHTNEVCGVFYSTREKGLMGFLMDLGLGLVYMFNKRLIKHN